MKHQILATLFVTMAIVLFLAPIGSAQAQTQTSLQYKVQLSSDRSAVWTITQTSDLNGTVDTWSSFQSKVTSLVLTCANQTGRQMSVDNDSLQISTVTSGDSKTTEYTFTWLNFSETQNGQLIVGDVFGNSSFFDQLYGVGYNDVGYSFQINYPANYYVGSIKPSPNSEDNYTQTLQWFDVSLFINGSPKIVFQVNPQTASPSGQTPYVLIALIASVIAIGLSGGFLFVTRRKNRKGSEPAISPAVLLETEEEKVLRVLRSNGGTAYQSAITEQCKFSKAKTSQLLTALEKKGFVKRYKKGRDKIVNITENAKRNN